MRYALRCIYAGEIVLYIYKIFGARHRGKCSGREVEDVFFAMVLSDNESSCQFFAKLYIKHRGLMYGTAMKLVHDPAVAEDIVHDAIVRLIDKEETLGSLDCCSLKTYIVYTIRSLSLNYLRKQSKERLRTVEIDPECEDTAFIDRSPRPEEVLLM